MLAQYSRTGLFKWKLFPADCVSSMNSDAASFKDKHTIGYKATLFEECYYVISRVILYLFFFFVRLGRVG